MLIHAGLMDSRLSLLVGPDNALHQLRAHFDGGHEPKSMPCDSHTDASLWLNTPDHFPTSLPHVREQLTGEFVAKVNAI
jgi:hypothetical protein